MFNIKSAATAFLLASCLPTALAKDECRAVGWQSQTTVKGSTPNDEGVTLFRGDKKIGEAKQDRHWPGVCTDLMKIEGDGLEDTFAWASSCDINHFTYGNSFTPFEYSIE
ncbi:hypothetical protein N7481_000328 [Penicillium waksmanii]|uniref:uncharacterized protein n=1 Tax=Penicillium waksmanii TaxID=69791 RepID=UPI002547DD8E|nr:uncharacterized protein N7481_000328 [Penicillium waksmanii]KAJ5999919.1 hypothetical protein N7481_000328 [Penicillium waksmanii]